MVLAISQARAGVPAVAATNLPSASKPFSVNANYTGAGNPQQLWLVIGTSAAVPALYSDLTAPVALGGTDLNSETAQVGASGFSGQLSAGFSAHGAAGDHLWVCVVEKATAPAGADPLVAKSGPFITAA